MNNEKHFSEIMDKLKSLGFIISMDDFGTGYCKVTISSRQSNRQFKIFGTLEQEIKETKT